MSWYEMTNVKKSPINRRTSTGRRFRTARDGRSGHVIRADASDALGNRRRHRRRHRRRRRRRQQRQRDEERDEASPSPSSSPFTVASESLRRRSSPSSHGRSTSDEGRKRAVHGSGHGNGVVGPGPHGDALGRNGRRRVRCRLPRRLHEKITSRPSLPRRLRFGAAGDDDRGSRSSSGGQRSSDDDRRHRDTRAAFRCSANVVLLAHGNRSLHVLVIQRSLTRYLHVDHVTTATTVVRYKL